MATLAELVRAANDPRAPAREVEDINREVLATVLPGLDLPPLEDAQLAVQHILADPFLMAKAARLDVQFRPFTHRPSGGGPVSILHYGDYALRLPGDRRWAERSGPGGFAFLRQVAHTVDIVKAIVQTRRRQIAQFLKPERDPSPTGYAIVRRDGKKKLTREDEREIARIESFLANSGAESDPVRRRRLGRDALLQFVDKLLYDSLTLDAAAVELECTVGGKLAGYYAVDGATVRLCLEGYEGNTDVRALQVIDETPKVAYAWEDLAYGVRNPRTELQALGYGYAETEMVLRALTGYVNSFNFNEAGLSRNATPRGVLTVFGEYNREQQVAFKHQLQAMLRGASNRFNMPVLFMRRDPSTQSLAGVQYTRIDEFSEMFFKTWISLVVSIACAVYSIDPGEIHFDPFSQKNSSPLSGKDTEERLAHSRDKGLVPLLYWLEAFINENIVARLTDRYVFQWVGVHPEDEQVRQERIKLASTVDEVRAIDGKDPMENQMLGKAPVNPSLMQVYFQTLAAPGAGAPGPSGGGQMPEEEQTNTGAASARADRNGDQIKEIDFAKAAGPGAEPDDFIVVIERGVRREDRPLRVELRHAGDRT